MKILRTASRGLNFTGSYKKQCIWQRKYFFSWKTYVCLSLHFAAYGRFQRKKLEKGRLTPLIRLKNCLSQISKNHSRTVDVSSCSYVNDSFKKSNNFWLARIDGWNEMDNDEIELFTSESPWQLRLNGNIDFHFLLLSSKV